MKRVKPLDAPCATCPFKREGGLRGLSRARVRDITSSIMKSDLTVFWCHNTVGYDEDENGEETHSTRQSMPCAGSLLFLDHVGRQWPVLARIGMTQARWDKLKKHAGNIVTSVKEMIQVQESL